jgi:hypothetical protein
MTDSDAYRFLFGEEPTEEPTVVGQEPEASPKEPLEPAPPEEDPDLAYQFLFGETPVEWKEPEIPFLQRVGERIRAVTGGIGEALGGTLEDQETLELLTGTMTRETPAMQIGRELAEPAGELVERLKQSPPIAGIRALESGVGQVVEAGAGGVEAAQQEKQAFELESAQMLEEMALRTGRPDIAEAMAARREELMRGPVGGTARFVGDVAGACREQVTPELLERGVIEGIKQNPTRAPEILYLALFQNLPVLAGSAIAAAGAGPAGGLLFMGAQEGGGHYRELIEAGVPEEEARAAAATVGAVNAALEYIPVYRFLKSVKGETAAKSIMSGVAVQMGLEAGTEMGQEVVSILSEQSVSDELQATLGENVQRIAESGIVGALLGAVFGAAGGRPAPQAVDLERGREGPIKIPTDTPLSKELPYAYEEEPAPPEEQVPLAPVPEEPEEAVPWYKKEFPWSRAVYEAGRRGEPLEPLLENISPEEQDRARGLYDSAVRDQQQAEGPGPAETQPLPEVEAPAPEAPPVEEPIPAPPAEEEEPVKQVPPMEGEYPREIDPQAAFEEVGPPPEDAEEIRDDLDLDVKVSYLGQEVDATVLRSFTVPGETTGGVTVPAQKVYDTVLWLTEEPRVVRLREQSITFPEEPAPEAPVPVPGPPLAELPDLPRTIYRGYGRKDKAEAYGELPAPILGEGGYFAFSKEEVKRFGPKLEERELPRFNNPLVIDSDAKWNEIARGSGAVTPGGFSFDPNEAQIAQISRYIRDQGYDGVVVWWPDDVQTGMSDFNDRDQVVKRVRRMFGNRQVFIPGPEMMAPAPEAVEKEPVKQVERPPADIPAERLGEESTISTPAGREVNFQWALVEFEDLGLSHDLALNPREEFPAHKQPRARERLASEKQVEDIGTKLDVKRLGESPVPSIGALVVDPSLDVLAGHGRGAAIGRAYAWQEWGEKYKASGTKYKAFARSEGKKKGLSVKGMRQPVLVRVVRGVEGTQEIADLVAEMNEPEVAAMSATETAQADARKITPEMLEGLKPSE